MIRILAARMGFVLLVAVVAISLSLRGETPQAANPLAHRIASFADQATHGHDTYTGQCSACHQEDLSGTDMVPALAGSAFLARWQGKTAKNLFDQTRTTMPASNPGSLSQEEYLNLTAYILQANDITPPQDLTADTLASVAIHN